MKLAAALEYEKLRQDNESWNKIVCHKDGKFYHMYEWSAWLVKTIACTEEFQQQRGDPNILQAKKYKGKAEEYVQIGFPLESLSKYVPEYLMTENLEDGDLVLTIDFNPDVSYEELQQSFEEWKQTCPYQEQRKRSLKDVTNGKSDAPRLARSGMFQILQKILSYPVERTTPAENIDFISQLRQDVAAMF